MINNMYSTTFKHQVVFYLICGAFSTSCDFLIYYNLYHYEVQMDIAKGTSFLVATLISYFLNKYFTFKTKQRSIREFVNFVVVHIMSMLVDVGANRLFVFAIGLFIVSHQKIFLAFILATSLSVVVNFAGQRYWVFNKK